MVYNQFLWEFPQFKLQKCPKTIENCVKKLHKSITRRMYAERDKCKYIFEHKMPKLREIHSNWEIYRENIIRGEMEVQTFLSFSLGDIFSPSYSQHPKERNFSLTKILSQFSHPRGHALSPFFCFPPLFLTHRHDTQTISYWECFCYKLWHFDVTTSIVQTSKLMICVRWAYHVFSHFFVFLIFFMICVDI